MKKIFLLLLVFGFATTSFAATTLTPVCLDVSSNNLLWRVDSYPGASVYMQVTCEAGAATFEAEGTVGPTSMLFIKSPYVNAKDNRAKVEVDNIYTPLITANLRPCFPTELLVSGGAIVAAPPPPLATPTATITPTVTPSPTVSPTVTPTVTPTGVASPTITPTASPTPDCPAGCDPNEQTPPTIPNPESDVNGCETCSPEVHGYCCETIIDQTVPKYCLKVCKAPLDFPLGMQAPGYNWVCNYKDVRWEAKCDKFHIAADPGHCAYVGSGSNSCNFPGLKANVGRVVLREKKD